MSVSISENSTLDGGFERTVDGVSEVYRSDPIIAVNDDLMRQLRAGNYVATIESTKRLTPTELDELFEKTVAAFKRPIDLCITFKVLQHVRANLEYYVLHFAAKPQVTYFCTDNIEDAIRIRLILNKAGRHQRILLLYASAPEFADLYIQYEIEPCVFDAWWIEQALRRKSDAHSRLRVHVWVDVGMAREGVLPTDLGRLIPALEHDGIVVEGLATHFNCVVQEHAQQKARFEEVLQTLKQRGISPRVLHTVGSHNGVGYDDVSGSFSVDDSSLDMFYDMVRPGSSLGMGVRYNLHEHHEPVLRVTIPIREARIAHVKTMPAGWNLGYGNNKFPQATRIAVLEGTRLNSLRYESFHRQSGSKAEALRSLLSNARVACLELNDGEWNAGDMLTCHSTILLSFLTRSFERAEDGKCRIAVMDAKSGEISRVAIVVKSEIPSTHLFHYADQFVAALLMRDLEYLPRRKWFPRMIRAVASRLLFSALLVARRLPVVSKRINASLPANRLS